jgi:hypothetical protein
MLSTEARRLLRIPRDAALPVSLAELYDRWFAGRSYETRFGEGWTFNPRGMDWRDGYDPCLHHRTAQFEFGLDSRFRVYVQCRSWILIASSFISLVERDALLVASSARGESRRGLGTFPNHEDFVMRHCDYLASFEEVMSPDPGFARVFRGHESVIIASRFYSAEYAICGIEYF